MSHDDIGEPVTALELLLSRVPRSATKVIVAWNVIEEGVEQSRLACLGMSYEMLATNLYSMGDMVVSQKIPLKDKTGKGYAG